MKNVLIISASLRQRSNSEHLAAAFAAGAREAGHTVEEISLKGRRIAFCTGCLTCQKTGRCVIADDARAIAEKVKAADVIVFASPVYYYSIAGQLKTLLDRMNPLFSSEYNFRDIYFLASAADDAPEALEGPQKAIQGWVDCFEKARLAGTAFAGGCTAPGSAEDHPALAQAFAMGRGL